MADSARRWIYFFATQLTDRQKNVVADQAAAWKALEAMPLTGPAVQQQRLRRVDKHMVEAVRVAAIGNRFEGRFFRDRDSDLPMLGSTSREDEDRVLSLPQGYALRHSAHFVWLDLSKMKEFQGGPARTEGLLIAELNRDAPRVSGIGNYIYDIFEGAYRMSVEPVLRDDVFAILKRRNNEVKSWTVRMPYSRAKDEGIGGMFVPSVKKAIGRVTVTARAKRGEKIDVTQDLPRLRRHLAESPEEESVVLDLGEDVKLDLLRSVLRIRGADVPFLEGGKAVDPVAMLKELRSVLDDNRDDVIAALGRAVAS